MKNAREKKLISLMRTGMFDLKASFKKKYNDLKLPDFTEGHSIKLVVM